MKKLTLVLLFMLPIFLSSRIVGQDTPSLAGQVAGNTYYSNSAVLWDQMGNPGTSSITSQNFETANDLYDSFAADDFGLMDDIWSVTQIDLLGAYYNGAGPASSVNVWFYSDSAGLPNQIIYTELNNIPVNGLTTGSFSIILSTPVVLNEGMYWICIQANMDMSPFGQWGWTERTISSFSESAWKNPGGGFGTTCTTWKHRITECSVGTGPDLCFSLTGDIIPVELSLFDAAANGTDVLLNWSTATETNNSGFEVQRKQSDISGKENEWKTIAFINGYGTTTEPNTYSYVDKNLSTGKLLYRLKQIDYSGTYEYSDVIEVTVMAPDQFILEQNYPNPFNPSTIIHYTIPLDARSEAREVSLKIYDVLGNEVTTLVDEYKAAGNYSVEFNLPAGRQGPSSINHYTSSGIYFYQLKAGSLILTKKMTVIK